MKRFILVSILLTGSNFAFGEDTWAQRKKILFGDDNLEAPTDFKYVNPETLTDYDPKSVDDAGNSVLTISPVYYLNKGLGGIQLLKALIDKGADVNLENENGRTILDKVVMAIGYDKERQLEVVKFLLDNGAFVAAATVDAASDDSIRQLLLSNYLTQNLSDL